MQHKLPGWIGAIVVLLAIAAGSWVVWRQLGGGGPRVGERIELAPESPVRRDARRFEESVQRALQQLGRNRSGPTTSPAARPPATTPAP
ncbi:MAG: hypothetical protein NZ561_07825, partial [Phycisphaerae bacterium]|nr:hypothetical protein [Phycisphaerae bacterium]